MLKLETLRGIARNIKRELLFYQRLMQHPATPRPARILLWCAIGYVLLPFDLIPDFIPIIGQLDDLVIVPLLVIFALKLTPHTVIESCRNV